MEPSTEIPIQNLLPLFRSVYGYKHMISIVLSYLSKTSRDQGTGKLLQDLSTQEHNDANDWKNQFEEMMGTGLIENHKFLQAQVRIMSTILGWKGFLEWLIIAEDEAIESLMNTANTLSPDLGGKLIRSLSDEYLHIIRMKTDLLGMEGWEMAESGGISDLIFGANDGLVSILALVAGVFGALTDNRLILITGIAGAIAGTISMGAGAYLSSKSEKEVKQKENKRKTGGSGLPHTSREILIEIYQAQGMKKKEAETVAERVSESLTADMNQAIGVVPGISTDDEWPPSKSGLLTGMSFLVASVIPILPFAFLEANSGAVVAILASVLALFAIGASKAVFTRSSWIKSGLENMGIGILAATATFFIGRLFPGI